MGNGIHSPPCPLLAATTPEAAFTLAFDAFPLVFIGFIIIAAIAAFFAWQQEKKRREEKQALADRLGLLFHPGVDHSHDDLFERFEMFRRGHSRRAMNTLTGTIQCAGRAFPCKMGDYQYKITSGSGKNRSTTVYNFSYCALEIPFGPVPNLLIRPEGLFDKLSSVFGSKDIEMESAEFNKRFHVQSPDRRFAYDICHPRMMEFLLQNPGPTIDIEGGRICLADGRKRWSVPAYEDALRWADRFFEQWPRHVMRELDPSSAPTVGAPPASAAPVSKQPPKPAPSPFAEPGRNPTHPRPPASDRPSPFV